MKKTMLVTRPCYDGGTSYLFYYAGLVIKEAGSAGVSVIDLKRPRLTKEKFTEIVWDKSPSLIFFNAHGSEKAIYGDKLGDSEEVLVEEGKNHSLLDSKIVYARACLAAASLGRACNGGCFIGYNTPFSFVFDEQWSAKPSNDNIAKLFLEPSNLIVRSLLKGNTAEEAAEKSFNMSKKNMLKLLKEKGEPGGMASMTVLWNNMTRLEVLGNKGMAF